MSVRRTAAAVAGLILLATTACGGGDESPAAAPAAKTSTSQPTDPQASEKPAAQDSAPVRTKVVVDAQGGGAGQGLCTLFSQAEIAERFGGEVGAGQVSGPLDSACQWSATADTGGSIMIQRVPAGFWSPPTMAKNYKVLTGIGDKAYSAPGMVDGDWDAAALHGRYVTVANQSGPKASADGAVALLREVLARG
ncbi:hypothetical protein FB561_3200 [Kribbella amoyensis]|uniref:Lipoprotein n=1 Tax=Kribbella amoyensis TaxID=996641 RepID=A0A561BT61_9ACTN|nr:hypothetical protein [Kribbella amoyensis]TWD82074.1 hypothetical protein FB561_3200 [Kribbella amoyensis]